MHQLKQETQHNRVSTQAGNATQSCINSLKIHVRSTYINEGEDKGIVLERFFTPSTNSCDLIYLKKKLRLKNENCSLSLIETVHY